jgi:hypothetical protein
MRVVPALDLVQRVAHRLQEILVGGQDRSIQLEFDDRLRPVQRGQDRGLVTAGEETCHLDSLSTTMLGSAPEVFRPLAGAPHYLAHDRLNNP